MLNFKKYVYHKPFFVVTDQYTWQQLGGTKFFNKFGIVLVLIGESYKQLTIFIGSSFNMSERSRHGFQITLRALFQKVI